MTKGTRREDELIKLLLKQNTYQPAEYFGKSLSVSTKTIYNDLHEITESIKPFDLQIEKIPRKGIYLKGSVQAKEQLKSFLDANQVFETATELYSPVHRQLQLLSKIVLQGESNTYKELSKQFLVSVQSIKNDMDEVRQFIEKTDVRLELDQEKRQLIGEETDIQKMYKLYLINYWKKYHLKVDHVNENKSSFLAELFEPELVGQVTRFIDEMMTQTGKELNDYFILSLTMSLLILVSRLKIGKHIESAKVFLFQDINKMQLYLIALEFSGEMEKSTGSKFTKEDIQYICSLLLAHGVEPKIASEFIEEDMYKITEELINEMSSLLNVDFQSDRQLYHSLIAHIVPMVHRLKNDISVRNPLKETIKKQYTTMFTLTQYACSTIERSYKVLLNEDEVSFLTIHFQIAFEKIQMIKHVLIVCANGLATSELIFNRIKQNLPANVIVEIATEKQLKENKIDGIDLIIAAIPLKEIGIPVVHVSSLPTNEEVANIATYLTMIKGNEASLTNREASAIRLSKYVQKAMIFTDKEYKNKEQILAFLIAEYEKNNLVTKQFRESIYQREALGNTSIQSGVAIPHASPETVKETVISFMTVKKPVIWDANTVQLIVLIAIADKDMPIAKDLVSNIYDIINSNRLVTKIVLSQSGEEIQEIVEKEG